MKQDSVFASGEGDQWFQRNQTALRRPDAVQTDPVVRVIQMANLQPRRAIEVGASNGFRLHHLQQLFSCEVTAVDPSSEAIAQGRAEYPGVEFIQGVASQVPIAQDGGFDLVIVNAVLHWIDRSTLMRSCAELDRLLSPQGFLVIGDFHPASPERVNYHHRPEGEIYTYKQDYTRIFLATQLYTQCTSVVFDHANWTCHPDVASRDRYQIAVLKKTGEEAYVARAFHPHQP